MSTTTASTVKSPPVYESALIATPDEVRAYLAGRKTQLRIPVPSNTHITYDEADRPMYVHARTCSGKCDLNCGLRGISHKSYCGWASHGVVGDQLWIREAVECCELPKQANSLWQYAADRTQLSPEISAQLNALPTTGLPPGRMQRYVCRIVLEILDLELGRLQNITEEQAKAEGILQSFPDSGLYWTGGTGMTDERNPAFRKEKAVLGLRGGFGLAWEMKHYDKYPWSSNPVVWTYTVKRVQA